MDVSGPETTAKEISLDTRLLGLNFGSVARGHFFPTIEPTLLLKFYPSDRKKKDARHFSPSATSNVKLLEIRLFIIFAKIPSRTSCLPMQGLLKFEFGFPAIMDRPPLKLVQPKLRANARSPFSRRPSSPRRRAPTKPRRKFPGSRGGSASTFPGATRRLFC